MTNSLWMIFHVSKGEKLGRGKTFGTLGSIRVGGIYVERSFNANSKKFLEGQFFLWRLRNPPCALVLRFWVFSNPFCAKLEWFKTSRISRSCNEPKDIPWLWSNRSPATAILLWTQRNPLPWINRRIFSPSWHSSTHESWLPTAPNPLFPEWIRVINQYSSTIWSTNPCMHFLNWTLKRFKLVLLGGKAGASSLLFVAEFHCKNEYQSLGWELRWVRWSCVTVAGH